MGKKAPNPPFESQHHHLLHCLEKTTVKSPPLKPKSCIHWKTHNHFVIHFDYLGNRLYSLKYLPVKNSSFYVKLHHFCSLCCIYSSASLSHSVTNRNKVIWVFFYPCTNCKIISYAAQVKNSCKWGWEMFSPLSSNMLKIT